jgi:phosphoglucosamine mutase
VSRSSIFGTDGIRGVFGEPPIDAATLTRVGWALGDGLADAGRRPLVVLGGDTRDSTPEVSSWVESGLVRAGAAVANAGVVPTPAVAALVRELDAAAGVSISASHNPWRDNGVKLFDRSGFKWSQREERRLESRLGAAPDGVDGRDDASTPDPALGERYLAHLLAALPAPRALEGLRVAIDAANGAASPWARRLFEAAGARVEAFHDRPDGANINVGCGSTAMAEIARLTRETASDLGVALDGDADRCMVVDETGRVLDGDAILFLLARGSAASSPGTSSTSTSARPATASSRRSRSPCCSGPPAFHCRGWPLRSRPSRRPCATSRSAASRSSRTFRGCPRCCPRSSAASATTGACCCATAAPSRSRAS